MERIKNVEKRKLILSFVVKKLLREKTVKMI